MEMENLIDNLVKELERVSEEIETRVGKIASTGYFDYDVAREYHVKKYFNVNVRSFLMYVRINYDEITK